MVPKVDQPTTTLSFVFFSGGEGWSDLTVHLGFAWRKDGLNGHGWRGKVNSSTIFGISTNPTSWSDSVNPWQEEESLPFPFTLPNNPTPSLPINPKPSNPPTPSANQQDSSFFLFLLLLLLFPQRGMVGFDGAYRVCLEEGRVERPWVEGEGELFDDFWNLYEPNFVV